MFVYNHKQSEWRELAAMKTARAMFGTVIHNGKIIAVGGVNEEGLSSMCETYDFATNKYVNPSMPMHRYIVYTYTNNFIF